MNKTEKLTVFLAILAISCLLAPVIFAMSSTNYIINWDSINTGGTDYSSSTNYYMLDTIGELATGRSTSTNFTMAAGYRQGITDPQILQFSISSENESTKVSYTAFNNGGLQVTVSNAAGFSVGQYIGVVENEGASQYLAVGKITNIGGLVITVDQWDGDNGVMSAGPVGGDDWVYRMDSHQINLGVLTPSAVLTGIARTHIKTNAENGFTVSVSEDGNLRIGTWDIDDVTDGTVSAGSEEYGIETVGVHSSGTNDFSIIPTGKSIQVHNDPVARDRIGIIFKAAIGGSITGGQYKHTVSFYATPNF